MDKAGAMEWVAIALAFVAVIVILRYGSRPRCELCRRRHHCWPVDAAAPAPVPVTVVEPPADPGVDLDREVELEIDLTSGWARNGNGADPEPAGLELIAISWRADQPAPVPASGSDVGASN